MTKFTKLLTLILVTASFSRLVHANVIMPEGRAEPTEDVIIFDNYDKYSNLQDARVSNEEVLKKLEINKREMDMILQKPRKVNYVKFNIYDVTEVSDVDPEYMKKVLLANNRPNMAEEAESFVAAEEEYGINAWFLAGVCVKESSDFSSNFAKTRNNVAGVAAFDSNPNRATRYASKREALIALAKLFKESPYYVKKGKLSPYQINNPYSSDPNWSTQIVIQMNYWKNMGVK